MYMLVQNQRRCTAWSEHISFIQCPRACSNDACSNSACYIGACSNDACSNSACYIGACSNSACSNGACSNGACSNGACFNSACSNGACSDDARLHFEVQWDFKSYWLTYMTVVHNTRMCT